MLTKRALFPALLLLSSCSVVKSARIRDDWSQGDDKTVKRLAVVVSPLPDGKESVGKAWAAVARRYVNQKRDFLVKKEVAAHPSPELKDVCGGEDNIEGVLWLKPALTAKGSGFEVEVLGALSRCSDGREAWSGTAAGSFASKDPLLVEVTNIYVQEFGAEVTPYVPPALNVLRPLLDTLPQPVLTEEDKDEKITLD
ncbi:MAG: MXAN_6521/LA_1396 family lipoprotein [Archangium sp.]